MTAPIPGTLTPEQAAILHLFDRVMALERRLSVIEAGPTERNASDPDRARFRSRTYPGIAAACADQWGGAS